MEHHFYLMDNGLTLVGEREATARSMAMGFFVKTGARDETPGVAGVSHFLEHMMFKGTDKRSPEAVNREFDAMGAKYNAFTSEEETVYYGAVLPQFQDGLLDLLADMMRPALREADFEMEKNVILEEISMYLDRPQFVAFNLLKTTYYGSHPLGNSVLGSKASIAALTRDQMHTYFTSRYAANNLVLVATGNYDWPALVAQAQRLCGGWNVAPAPRETLPVQVKPRTVVERNDKFNRAHIALMAPGFAAQDERRIAAAVACNAIGSGEGSRLYWALVHPGVAQAAQMGQDANDGDGSLYGYILGDPERGQEALDTFREVLEKACISGLTEAEVERSKRRMASSMVLGFETPMGRLRPVGFDWMLRGAQRSPTQSLESLLCVTAAQVNQVLSLRPFDLATVAALGPLDSLN